MHGQGILWCTVREQSFPDVSRTHTAAEQAQLTRISERQRATVAPASVSAYCQHTIPNSAVPVRGDAQVHQEPITNTGTV